MCPKKLDWEKKLGSWQKLDRKKKKIYLVSCIPFRILEQIDIRELHILVIFWHPRIIQPPPAFYAL